MKPRIRIRKLVESNEPHEPNLPNNPQVPTLFQPINATLRKQPINPNNAPFDSSMALTVLALLIALFFMGLFSIYIRRFAAAESSSSSSIEDLSRRRRRRRRQNQNNNSPIYIGGPPPRRVSCPNKGVDPSTVRSLPVYYYHHGDAKQVMNDCLVCLSEFVEREEVKMIPSCRHVFHPYCIERWLSSHVSCPLCRTTRFFPVKEDDVREVDVDVEERSTVVIEDTWTSSGVRRTSSCSSLGEERGVSLQRTSSF